MNDDVGPPDIPDSSIVHQIKNRLTVVKGVAELLDRQVRRDDWQREKIVERVDRLQGEIAQLEDLIANYEPGDDAIEADSAGDPVH